MSPLAQRALPLHQQGLPAVEIARRLAEDYDAVWSSLRWAGVKPITRREAGLCKNGHPRPVEGRRCWTCHKLRNIESKARRRRWLKTLAALGKVQP